VCGYELAFPRESLPGLLPGKYSSGSPAAMAVRPLPPGWSRLDKDHRITETWIRPDSLFWLIPATRPDALSGKE
jgi:hypothetical protein